MNISKIGGSPVYQGGGKKTSDTKKKQSASGSTEIKKSPANSMSMDDYKKYIDSRISDMTPGGSDYNGVIISEEGYAAMKNDPDYEKKVLGQLSSAMASGGSSKGEVTYTVYHVGSADEGITMDRYSSEDVKKQMEADQKMKEEFRKRMEKERVAKSEHYRQYKKRLVENSIRKAEIEQEHIKGNFDDMRKKQKNLNAIDSYKAVMNSDIGSGISSENKKI